ncbi:DNA gyrase inhibitor YacG [bacterium]|nr:MAG: DNA gyrase inhibitor YacG [bacterium]
MAPTTTSCPTCKRPVTWGPESPYRPFCSDRCRLIDLGAWFSGERAIPAEEGLPPTPDSED